MDHHRHAGSAVGRVRMSPGFDDPLSEFPKVPVHFPPPGGVRAVVERAQEEKANERIGDDIDQRIREVAGRIVDERIAEIERELEPRRLLSRLLRPALEPLLDWGEGVALRIKALLGSR